jgi:hypothetical protein
MRRFTVQLAWYFGLKLGDGPPPSPAPRSRPRLLRRVVGAIIIGALFALISAGLGGFDDSLASLAFRGALFALAIGAWGLAIERMAEAEDRRRPRDLRGP